MASQLTTRRIDIDPVKKSEEIYRFFLGKPVYEQMVKDYGGFKKLNLTHP